MSRREFRKAVKLAAWERCGGVCDKCTTYLFPGRFQYDHDIPDGLGGEPTLDNCLVLCSACHGAKTAKVDVPRIAKTKRVKAAHLGIKATKRPMPGSRASGLRKRMNGKVERR